MNCCSVANNFPVPIKTGDIIFLYDTRHDTVICIALRHRSPPPAKRKVAIFEDFVVFLLPFDG